jgi:hypothetical protein
MIEDGNLSIKLPELYVMTIYQLLRGSDGGVVVRTVWKTYGASKMAVESNDVNAIIGQKNLP